MSESYGLTLVLVFTSDVQRLWVDLIEGSLIVDICIILSYMTLWCISGIILILGGVFLESLKAGYGKSI